MMEMIIGMLVGVALFVGGYALGTIITGIQAEDGIKKLGAAYDKNVTKLGEVYRDSIEQIGNAYRQK